MSESFEEFVCDESVLRMRVYVSNSSVYIYIRIAS
jgi:hypothetical protein